MTPAPSGVFFAHFPTLRGYGVATTPPNPCTLATLPPPLSVARGYTVAMALEYGWAAALGGVLDFLYNIGDHRRIFSGA